MGDETTSRAHEPGGAAKRDETHDKSKRESEATEAGQEARRGVPPGEHDDEHQSEYGGGGRHGGVK